MWRTGLLYLDRGDSAIISALRDAGYNTQQNHPGSPNRRFSAASSTDTEIIWERRVKTDIPSPHHNIQQWMSPPDGTSIKFSRPRSKLPDPMDQLSPTTDATLFEEPQLHSLDLIREERAAPDYFAYPNALEKSPSIKSASTILEAAEPAANQTRPRVRHARAASIVSTLSNGPKTPTTPRSFAPIRANTDGLLKLQSGEKLLKLQADTTKPPVQRSQSTRTPHARRISLGLPIKAPNAAPSERPPPSRRAARPLSTQTSPTTAECETPSRPQHPPRYSQIMNTSSVTPANTIIQQERELEYKHRHTFIGTASLDDFLEVLDVSPAHTTSKAAVVRAFLLLASSERLLARQASTTPSGWSLVSRTTSDTVNVDYVEQAHAKLGSIVLRQFLDLIPFDEDEVAGAISVVEAFTACSHLDAKGSGAGSKAKAFRSWMVRAQSD